MDAASLPPPPPPSGDDWELVAANEVHVVDALKQEGNALFQRHQLLDAIQVYALALSQLPRSYDHFTPADRETLVALEVAVLLNRALAYIELQDEKLLRYADDDCSAALVKQPLCVKAFYRRALARERLGNIKTALADAERMLELDPANPAAHQLLTRLQEAWSSQTAPKPVLQESALATALQKQCTVSKAASQAAIDASKTTSAALDAWQALQDEELRLRQAVKQSGGTTKRIAVMSKKSKKKTSGNGPPESKRRGGEVCAKTESLWATLAQEEESTVAAVYKKRKPTAAGNHKTASIQPWSQQ